MIKFLLNIRKCKSLLQSFTLQLLPQFFVTQENIKSEENKSQTPDLLPNELFKKVDENDSYFHDVHGPQLSYLSNDCQNFGRKFDYYGDPIMP